LIAHPFALDHPCIFPTTLSTTPVKHDAIAAESWLILGRSKKDAVRDKGDWPIQPHYTLSYYFGTEVLQ